MAAAADKTKKTAEKDKTAKPRSPILITALVAVLAAGAAGGGVWFFTQSKHEDKTAQAPKKTTTPAPAPAQYFALEPAFVVNLNGSIDGPRYLQVEVQLMTRDPAALEAIKTHAPAIRARLLMLFSQVSPQQIADIAGKQKLQADSLAEVQKVLKAETGSNGADDLLFTSFVTQ
ncbi:flagellar basal body protein FliL [Stenotrophomonas lactitubi]|uniref:flagellar basal body-associated FliL family protein n=1 Tax=Stenotrophomonas lactitubi TaxID=2045214 RepID=UPI000C271B7E|nr:flagellar basal body-associated FliL family protein [Stenotrophomonas lactitubi]PJO52185.1 flagellar basal body protein FliL [Stenotrophomonas lactitubi]